MRPLKDLVRRNIWDLCPYSSARDEYKGVGARVFLDANESPFNSPLNRYPDPLQRELKGVLSGIKGVPAECIFLGNGSDEAIDLVYRIFCEPGVDNVVSVAPTYGMYRVAADVNGVAFREVLLGVDFGLDSGRLLDVVDERTKVVFLCSPNNPTGNVLSREEIVKVLEGFGGIVVVDEAYGDFSVHRSMRASLGDFPNLVVLNTMSKAWASAGIRLGMAFAGAEIIGLFNKVKYPYNISVLTQKAALEVLGRKYDVSGWVRDTLRERDSLMRAFAELPLCVRVFPTDANFFLARVCDADAVYGYLVERGVVVRNRSSVVLCGDCLRITVGNSHENSVLLGALRLYKMN